MVKIRLSRIGAKGQPYYRVVVVDSRRKRDTKVLETIGHYNPRTEPSSFDIKKDRLDYWRSVGAQLTEPVLVLLGETEPKKHQPKNVKEGEAQTPAIPAPAVETPSKEISETSAKEKIESTEEAPAEGDTEVDSALEETPDASPELAKVVDASETATAAATPEEIEQTVDNTEGTATDVEVAEERQPTTQDEKVSEAEVADDTDDQPETK